GWKTVTAKCMPKTRPASAADSASVADRRGWGRLCSSGTRRRKLGADDAVAACRLLPGFVTYQEHPQPLSPLRQGVPQSQALRVRRKLQASRGQRLLSIWERRFAPDIMHFD